MDRRKNLRLVLLFFFLSSGFLTFAGFRKFSGLEFEFDVEKIGSSKRCFLTFLDGCAKTSRYDTYLLHYIQPLVLGSIWSWGLGALVLGAVKVRV
jgi:hypothetical protein